MNFKTFAFAAALLASTATLAVPTKGAPSRVAPGCRGGQMEEMACTQGMRRGSHSVLIHHCADSTFLGEFVGPGPDDRPVTMLSIPVSKLIPRGNALPEYLGKLPRGTSFTLIIDTKKPVRGGGFVGHFVATHPDATDKIQTTKMDLVCRQPK